MPCHPSPSLSARVPRHAGALAALAAAFLLTGLAASAPARAADGPPADEVTRALLQPAEFQRISISPDGSKLAIARHVGNTTSVTVHERVGLKPLIKFDSGTNGMISQLRWIDDQRLLVGATRLDTQYGLLQFNPILLVANLDGTPPLVLPGNFMGTVEGDPDHIYVSGCGDTAGKTDCKLSAIRKRSIRKGDDKAKAELVIQGPADTWLSVNRDGTTGFAVKSNEDDESTVTYVYDRAKKAWSVINDGSATKLEVAPIGVSIDGATGFLLSQRKEGPDMIERYDFASGKRTPLYADPVSDPLRTVSSLDGLEILGAYYESTTPTLHLWLPDHPDARILTDLQAAFPGKFVLITSASKDRNLLVLNVSSDRDPGAWYLFDRVARKASVLARENPWIDPGRQASTKPFTLKARDGLELHGLLTLPPNSSGKGVPLVVMPHGGPYWVRDVWGYDPELQILGQHGYAVLQVNFRGSGGYGWQFIDKGARQWGRAMQDDVSDATRWAIAQGVADPKRICIYGSSYGGYAALMGPIREPGLYQCAASFAAPTNLATMFKWGSIRNGKLGKKYLDRALGTDKVDLAARSPARHAAEIGVPVFLAHGYRDARVDVRHAHDMKSELSKRRQPVEYVEYPETGHGLAIEKYQLDFYARLLRFLDRNIGPGSTGSAQAGGGVAPTGAASSQN